MKQQSKKEKQKLKYQPKSSKGDSKIKIQTKSSSKGKEHSNENGLQHLPTIQSLLSIPADQRSKKVVQLFNKIVPFLHTFIQKKQGSRVTQLMFKWGSYAQVKKKIFQCINKHWKQLTKSKYALYVISKVIAQKQFTLDQVADDCINLMNGRQSAHVLENYIKKNLQNPKVKQIKNKFIDLSIKAKQDMRSQQILHNIATKSIQKQYHNFLISKLVLRLTLKDLFDQQKQKALDFLIENIASIVDDEQGVKLFIQIINNSTPKQKKNVIKAYKGNIEEIIGFNNVSYVTIIKLITQIDDTVQINKTIVDQLLQLLPKFFQSKNIFRIIFSLFSPRNHNFNVLGKYQHQVVKTMCKKPQQQRKKQIRIYCYPALVKFFTQQDCKNLSQLVKMPQQGKLVIGIIRSMLQDNYQEKTNFINEFANLYLSQLKSSSQKKKSNSQSKIFQNSLICDNNANKIFKNILSIQEQVLDPICDKTANILIENLDIVLKTKASFVLLGLIEKGGRNWLLDEIKKEGVKLDKAVAGEHFQKLIEDKPFSKNIKNQSQNKNSKKSK